MRERQAMLVGLVDKCDVLRPFGGEPVFFELACEEVFRFSGTEFDPQAQSNRHSKVVLWNVAQVVLESGEQLWRVIDLPGEPPLQILKRCVLRLRNQPPNSRWAMALR
jgi:hypothetical protein